MLSEQSPNMIQKKNQQFINKKQQPNKQQPQRVGSGKRSKSKQGKKD
jgi:hypothetical protein